MKEKVLAMGEKRYTFLILGLELALVLFDKLG